jgi:two-component system cell cycle response regulator DivK
MRILIEVHGFRVIEETAGREAVERAREFRPDLILMDLAMPAFDGIQATCELKSDPELRDIRIVAITSHNHAFHDEALAAGCTKVVDKPITLEEMEKLLVGLLSG